MRMGHFVNFKEELKRRTEEAEHVIREYLPEESGFAKTMAEAMNYSMTAGGKRLRPILIRETYELFGGKDKLCEPFMAAMEMIHTHSLIHDDLPALDNDDYRRGRLTTHKVYGEAMGVLSGVALLNRAYEVMLSAFDLTEDKDRVIAAMRIIADKTGINGMLGGQSVDVENDGKPLEHKMLDYIYKNISAPTIIRKNKNLFILYSFLTIQFYSINTSFISSLYRRYNYSLHLMLTHHRKHTFCKSLRAITHGRKKLIRIFIY